jgi:hypothetical protein
MISPAILIHELISILMDRTQTHALSEMIHKVLRGLEHPLEEDMRADQFVRPVFQHRFDVERSIE